jgi:hypothetical protein
MNVSISLVKVKKKKKGNKRREKRCGGGGGGRWLATNINLATI